MDSNTVLVADDDPVSLAFQLQALQASGIRAQGAGDGRAALELAAGRHFALWLLDARMPELDGIATLAALRARCQATPALATTADPDPAVHARLRAAGFDEVLCKPVRAAGLVKAVRRRLPGSPGAPAPVTLDDRAALAATGGDAGIVSALRELFRDELATLPAEFEALARHGDLEVLRERLHRLQAAAGFCGAAAIESALAGIRPALDGPAWPATGLAALLEACAATRQALG